MKNMMRISYTFLLLAVGIISTILSNPVLAQTEGNQTGQQQQGGQQQGGEQQQGGGQGTTDDIGSIEELQQLTTSENPLPPTSNDTSSTLQELEKETGTDNQTGGQQQGGGQGQEGNQTGGQQQGGEQQQGGGQGQEGNQTGGQQQGEQEGNQSGNPLSDALQGLGNLFQ